KLPMPLNPDRAKASTALVNTARQLALRIVLGAAAEGRAHLGAGDENREVRVQLVEVRRNAWRLRAPLPGRGGASDDAGQQANLIGKDARLQVLVDPGNEFAWVEVLGPSEGGWTDGPSGV